jgi:hypothetical protein
VSLELRDAAYVRDYYVPAETRGDSSRTQPNPQPEG